MNAAIKNPLAHNSKGMLSFNYGDECIIFERTKRINDIQKVLIKVSPDCKVQVSAPADTRDDEVIAAVKKRGRWIYQQLREFRQQSEHITLRKYVSGESHYYLGKQYVLKVIVEPDVLQQVKLLRGKLEVTVRSKSPKAIQALLNEWYKERAKEIFTKRLDAMLEQTLWVKKRPPIRMQAMKTQWGSCSPHGRLTLNPHLVKASRECIDYVLLHELCHISQHNHSKRFYRLMNQVMPNWEKVKNKLDGMAGKIID